MDEETKIELAVNADVAAADEAVHRVWRNKELLAPVLKAVVPELESRSVEEIITLIDADIRTSDTVSGTDRLHAQDRGTEYYELSEKLSRFDVHIKVKNPELSKEELLIMLHIDYEIENRYKKAYPNEKRAMYYVARELVSQLDYVTGKTDYAGLEKCYSIWVFVKGVPEKEQNTITAYEMGKRDVTGCVDVAPEVYDLMSVVFIRMGKQIRPDTVFEYVKAVIEGNISIVDKYVNIEDKKEIREEVRTMQGFASVWFEDGLEQGIEQGIERGRERRLIEQICKKLRRGKSVPQIAEEVEEDEIRVKLICDIAERYAPEYDTEQVFTAVQRELVDTLV